MFHGRVVEGRFELERAAGSGGMGVVYRARDRRDGAAVAVKLLRGDDPEQLERFERESAVLAELRHPAIVRYVAHGATAAGERWLAMEWLEGEDLGQRLARRRLEPGEALAVLRRTATALACAHARGVVHRDLKPGNLFLVGGDVERLKVLDFGLARVVDDPHRLTRSGVVMGTPGYLAPEQVLGEAAIDVRGDVFALGCVIFEVLGGRPAFEGANALAVLAKIVLSDTPRLRTARADVPEPVEELVARMLARRPAARPPDGGALLAEIDAIADVWLSWATEAGPLPSPRPPPGTLPPPSLLRHAITNDEQRVVSVVLAGGAPPALAEPEIERLGGHLDVLGDGSTLITLWGPGSAVDRAERAARCALHLRRRLPGAPVCVVTGRGVSAARLVDSEVIERGARAVRDAPAGAILVDEVTAGMLGPRFVVAPAEGGIALQGERAPDEAAPTFLGRPSPCMGRGREIAVLEGLFGAAIADAQAAAAVVVGAPGSGKSRLRREVVDRLRRRHEGVEVLSGVADSVGEGAPFGLLADALRRAAGIERDEPLGGRREKLAARVGRHLRGEARDHAVAFLGELARAPFPDEAHRALRAARDEPRIMGDAVRAAFQAWLAAECGAAPVLLVLEDLHWGDAATVHLVDAALRAARELPFMVLATARPEALDRFPLLWAARDAHVLKLGPLSRRASEELVRAALGDAEALVARLVERGGGNPFYLEELVRAVAERRADDFPDSILGVVEARLDAEGLEAKRVLRAASVFGERFSPRGVAALLGGEAHLHDVAGWLEILSARELVAPAGLSGADPVYAFGHAFVREAAYATLTGADRAVGHRLAGAFLEASCDGAALPVAEHFRRSDSPERAVPWYRRAAEDALDASDLDAALDRAARGIAAGAAGEELGRLTLALAEAHLWRGDLALAEERGLEAMTRLPPGAAEWFDAARQVAHAAGKLGEFDRVERLAREAQEDPQPGAGSARVRCLCDCVIHLVFGGRYAAADAVLSGIASPAGLDASAAARLAEARSIRAFAAGDPAACIAGLEAALIACEEAGDARNACVTRSNLGFACAELGAYDRAEDALRGALAVADRLGLTEIATAVLHNLGRVLGYAGQLEEAEQHERAAVEAFRKQGDPRLEGLARTYLAEIQLRAGDLLAGEREARTAAGLLRGGPPLLAGALATLARTLLAQGRAAEAAGPAGEAFALLESLGALEEGESLVRLVHAEVLAALGDGEGSRRAVTAAHARLRARAAHIGDPGWRARFLAEVPENARTVALATGG